MLSHLAIRLMLLALAALGPAGAAADPIADFYKGKSLRVIVGYAPGGGFDAYARLLAEHLPKYLPGSPVILVQSMPGAATVKAANYIYSVAPQDGTVIGIPNHAVPMNAFVWRDVGEGMDVTKLNWIGRLDAIDVVNVAWHATGVKSVDDVKKRPLIIAATSPTGTSVMMPTAINRLIGTQFKVVEGYKGTAEEYIAMERGETEGVGNAIWSQLRRSHPHWIAEKRLSRFIRTAITAQPDWKMCRPRSNWPRTTRTARCYGCSAAPPKSAALFMSGRRCRRNASPRCARLSWKWRRIRFLGKRRRI
jgi:hypothetical protein